MSLEPVPSSGRQASNRTKARRGACFPTGRGTSGKVGLGTRFSESRAISLASCRHAGPKNRVVFEASRLGFTRVQRENGTRAENGAVQWSERNELRVKWIDTRLSCRRELRRQQGSRRTWWHSSYDLLDIKSSSWDSSFIDDDGLCCYAGEAISAGTLDNRDLSGRN